MLAVVAAVAGAIWAAAQIVPGTAEKPVAMAAMLPQGALLSIESPDFGALLHDWERSPEQAAWMKSDSYGMFSRSRLFGRLSEAQEQFAGAAGMAADGGFLDEIAGTDSIFAWYDIGKLEFLYITRLAPGKAEQTRLMQSRSSFSERQAGGATFYVRTRGDDPRTVAFAVSGDYLLLATREDLMASALALRAHSSNDSLATEPWFMDAGKAATVGSQTPALRMALDLDRIVKTPYFRSYWVERNVSEMNQYRAAMVDLYREPSQMREERVLLPKSVEDAGASQAELGELAALAPARAAVYRAVATGDAAVAEAALEEKLLRRGPTAYVDTRVAPSVDLTGQETGSASDLETRIDAAPLAAAKPEDQTEQGERMQLLRAQMAATGVVGVLTVDSNEAGETDAGGGMWVPLHSAVVIRAAKAWDEVAVAGGLEQVLEPELSAGALGLGWTRVGRQGGYESLGQVRPLQMAVRGDLLLVADDAALMEAILARVGTAVPAAPMEARLVGGFDHDAAAGGFARLSELIDGAEAGGDARRARGPGTEGSTPAFFSADLAGLSRTFAAMKSERVVERQDGAVMRQTVTYVWQR